MLQIRNKINNQIILYKVHIEVEVQQAVHRPCPEATSQKPLLGQLFEGVFKVARSWLDHQALIIRVTKNIDLINPDYKIIQKKFQIILRSL